MNILSRTAKEQKDQVENADSSLSPSSHPPFLPTASVGDEPELMNRKHELLYPGTGCLDTYNGSQLLHSTGSQSLSFCNKALPPFRREGCCLIFMKLISQYHSRSSHHRPLCKQDHLYLWKDISPPPLSLWILMFMCIVYIFAIRVE